MLANNIGGKKDLKYIEGTSFQSPKTKFTYFLPNFLNVCSKPISSGLCDKDSRVFRKKHDTTLTSSQRIKLRSEVASGLATNLQEIENKRTS